MNTNTNYWLQPKQGAWHIRHQNSNKAYVCTVSWVGALMGALNNYTKGYIPDFFDHLDDPEYNPILQPNSHVCPDCLAWARDRDFRFTCWLAQRGM